MHLGLRYRLVLGLESTVLAAGLISALAFPASRWPLLGLTGVVVVLVWIVWLLATAKVHGALNRVRRVADAIGRGDLSVRVESSPGDDVAKLARSINRMADRLEEAAREQLRLEQRLTRGEKLALVGELGATVAHEVNNPLDGLQNCTRIARRNLEDTEQVRRMLDLMDTGLYRIEMTVKRLLSLSKDQVAELCPTCLGDVVREATMFVESRLDRNHIELVTDVPDRRASALADRQQLVQVTINLMLNAIDAMPDGGRLTVRVNGPDVERGPLTLSVSDTGAGMDSERVRRIFEPFYSTKTGHGGTGLGLAVVTRIVEAHQGRITVTSEPGEGSTFTIELPTASSERRGIAESRLAAVTGDAG